MQCRFETKPKSDWICRNRTALWLTSFLLIAAGCGGGNGGGSEKDTAVQEDVADKPDSGKDAQEDLASSECTLEGTYTVTSTEILSGTCDIQIGDDSFAIRQIATGYIVDFDGTDWEEPVGSEAACTLSSDGPGNWFWNGASRTRSLAISVVGDTLTAEITDKLQGPSTSGENCDATLKLVALRSGPPPTGAAIGADACGGLGCSGYRCVFGGKFGCETGLCLFNTDNFDSYCTGPCAVDTDCPQDFVCLMADEGWDGAPEGLYCAKWRAVCGNDVLEEGELCDDGNNKDGDGCSADCKSNESCGNGILENDEFCEPSQPQEWLPCSDKCQFTPPEGVKTPLPIESEAVLAASTGPGSFVVAALPTFYAFEDGLVRFARTTDSGATWTNSTMPAGQFAYGRPVSLVSAGSKLALGMSNGSAAFYLSESQNGGASWTAATQHEIPGTAVSTDMASDRLELALLDDGTLLAVVGKEDGLVVARRAPGGTQWTSVASVQMCGPHGWDNGQLNWDPFRFESYSGGGVQVSVKGTAVTVLVAGTCYDATNNVYQHVAYALRSTDSGVSFAEPTDLMEASGLTNTTASPISPTPQGTAAICLAGLDSEGATRMRCSLAPASAADPWSFFETPLTFLDPYTSPAADAILAMGPQELLLAQNAADMSGGHLYRTVDGGKNWSSFNLGETISWNRSLRRLGPNAAWLIEVDGNNELSLVRLDLAQMVAATRFWLFGDARRGDGSGMPWRVAWAEDGQGAGILGFSIPDAIRYWITVVRPMN